MTQLAKDIELFDSHIGILNYRNLKHVDGVLAILVLALALLGFYTLYYASTGGGTLYYQKQMVFFGAGVALVIALVCLDYRFLVSLGPLFFITTVAALLAVLLVGTKAKGGQHWLVFGPFRVQPSEISKVGLVYMLTWYINAVESKIRRFLYFGIAFAIAGVVCGLIALQGDLGTTLALMPVPFVMLFAAGCRWWHLLLVMLAGIAAAPVGWKFLKPYQRNRLVSFIQPEADPTGSGYQLHQAKIAIGSGRLFGKGFNETTQAHLQYIPEYHNDFVFALLAEGKGFAGGALVILLFLLFTLRCVALASGCPDTSAVLLILGSMTIIGFHAFVNIAITVGLMPVTGLPLPFFSYGGSFYITTMMCVGTILSANVRRGLFE